MEAIQLPAPFAGVDELTPLAALQAPYCESILNFNSTREGVLLRKGDSKYYNLTYATGTKTAVRSFNYADTKLFNLVFNNSTNKYDLYDVDAASIVYTSAVTTNDIWHSVYFNNYLFMFGETTYTGTNDLGGLYYNGSSYGFPTYTGSGMFPVGGSSYRNRIYLISKNSAKYWYGDLYATSGACTSVDLALVTKESAKLAIIASITLTNGVTTDELLAFVLFSGEVLFYSGSYPDSPDWRIVGRAQIGTVLNYNAGVAYQGDYLVFADNNIVSLRDLFTQGSEAASAITMNQRIQKSWQSLVLAIRTATSNPIGRLQNIRGIYDSQNNRIIISFPYYLNSSGVATAGSYYFVYNTLLQSWNLHRSFGSTNYIDLVYYKNKALILTSKTGSPNDAIMIYQKEGSTGYTDRSFLDTADVGYDYEIKSAPITTGRAQYAKISSMDVIVKSDLHAETNYQVISDLGVNTSVAQKVNGQSGVLSKPNIPMGISGTYIQYKISGTTTSGKTSGYQLYGTNLWIDKGNSPR